LSTLLYFVSIIPRNTALICSGCGAACSALLFFHAWNVLNINSPMPLVPLA
jgi:hypothetical protein